MKIVQVIHANQFRGAEVFAKDISDGFRERGHEVCFFVLRNTPSDRKLNLANYPHEFLKSRHILSISALRQLNHFISKYEVDIAQANAGDTLKFAALSKWIFGWKQPLVFRNASLMGNYFDSKVTLLFYRFLLKQVTAVASVSNASAKNFKSLFPSFKKNIQVIPVGVNKAEIQQVKPVPFSKAVKNVVHIGGFSFEKNHVGLISIAEQLIASNPHVLFHLVGDGPLRSDIEALVEEKNLQAYFKFYGFVANPLDCIAAADVLVLPSIIEGLPSVILEAFALRVPVVAYNVGGISEIMEDGVTGYLVPKNNEKEFLEKLTLALKSDMSAIKENANSKISVGYSIEGICERFLALYERILN